MFGMVFGQAELETRLYPLNIDLTTGENNFTLDMWDITGEDLTFATFQVVGMEHYTFFDNVALRYQCDNIEEAEFFFWQSGRIVHQSPILYLDDSNCRIMNTTTNNSFNRDLYLSITAEFPEEDTGYIEEGFDYCIDVGANLVASPCRDEIDIIDTLPSEIQNNLTSIVGQGVAANNQDGVWVGSLNGLGGGDGYWFISNASACFNYNCAEN